MLALYLITLDRRISLENLQQVSSLDNLTWLAELSRAFSFLVTYPFHWLPAAWIPTAINLFAAICAALSLALLARCVALLPHDRTQEERERNHNKQAFLATRSAWLPPVLAVLACGLQITFWENSIADTDEMINLLLFAYLVRCLLEFRISRKESWLLKFAFVNGLAVANNWAMMLFLPFFVVAVLWITDFTSCFTPQFVARFLRERKLDLRRPCWMFACWLAGCLIFLLPPFLTAHSSENPVAFWVGLKFAAHNYYVLLTAFPAKTALLLCLTSVLPVFYLGIRWGQMLDMVSRWDGWAIRTAFHFVNAFFLIMCLWGALDSPFSPRHRQPAFPCLPLYFLSALSIGYFSGCFLLVFGPRLERFWRPPQRLDPFLNMVSIGAMWVLLLAMPAVLVYKNLPDILKRKQDPLAAYFDLLERTMPPKGAVILSEQSVQLQYLEATLIGRGRSADYLLIDTSLLRRFPNYAKFVASKYAAFILGGALAGEPAKNTGPFAIARWVEELARAREIYALHAYTGPVAESFFTEQHGLFFRLQPYSEYVTEAPAPSPALIATNQDFWRSVRQEQFSALFQRLQPPPGNPRWEALLQAAHIHPQPDHPALLAGEYYSMALNSWGVELQKSGMLAEASECFQQALPMSSANMPALLNLECNQALQAHEKLTLNAYRQVEDEFTRSRDWDESLRRDGPTDSPDGRYRLGVLLAQYQLRREAIQQFQRALALAPDSAEPHLRLAELYLTLGDNTNSLVEAGRALEIPPQQTRALVLQGLAFVQMQKFYQAIPPLNEALNQDTNNTDARLARAVAYLNVDKLQAAREDYQEVLRAVPKTYPAYYGLADIAYQMKDTAALIENCRLYLSIAPPTAPEHEQVEAWLKEVKTP